MKKLLVAVSLLATVLGTAPVVSAATASENQLIQARIDAMLYAVENHHPEVSLAADRYNTDLAFVMSANGISREDAIARMARALIAQNGRMPAPPVPSNVGAAYDPAPHAFRQAQARTFYAGVDPVTGTHVFTVEQRATLLDSFWYCAKGLTYTYGPAASACK